MTTLYILYSKSLDTYYTGSCVNLEERLIQHNEKVFESSFTARANDWQVYLKIKNLEYKQARKIESSENESSFITF